MPNRRRLLMLGLAAIPAAGLAGFAWTSFPGPAIHARGGHAIGGIDPVGYFADGRPVPGSRAHRLEWRGATWLFASADNRAAFAADPDALAPRYGGWCAYAVSSNTIAPTEPEAWTIHGGRLYLNANLRIRGRWEADRDRLIALADGYWPGALANRA